MTPHAKAFNSDLRVTLRGVTDLLAAARDDWWVIGSAALVLSGVDASPVADVDVIVSRRDGHHVAEHLGLADQAALTHRADARFQSHLLLHPELGPMPVDLMAGLTVAPLIAGDPRWPVEFSTRVPIDIGNRICFIPDRIELSEMLRRFGRPKDLQRRALLEATLS